MFQPQSLGNLNTNTFLSREIIIYSLTLLPVIKPLLYLRQNIFHNNKETNFSNCCLTTYRNKIAFSCVCITSEKSKRLIYSINLS